MRHSSRHSLPDVSTHESLDCHQPGEIAMAYVLKQLAQRPLAHPQKTIYFRHSWLLPKTPS